ncbi:type VII secretion target [Nocardia sp. SSK8]|uniref:type VII secretion target n=1 Tax=Nocardia sp. SSK8 TaxID=3120154 RepID=UPI00300966B0
MTKELKVEPDKLDTFAGVLTTLANDHAKAAPYAQSWLKVDADTGGLLFPTIAGTLNQLLGELETNLASLGTATQGSSAELTKAAQMYRTTDYANAAALDATYVDGTK